ncbi:hypothetical protein MOR12E_28875 [Methylobacterium oryzae]
MAQTAREMIDEFGRAMVLRRPNPGTYNAGTDSHAGGGAPVDTPIMAVVTQYREKEIDGEIIKRGDVRILIAGVKPDKDNFILDGVDTYTAVNVETLKPGDLALLYKVQARK